MSLKKYLEKKCRIDYDLLFNSFISFNSKPPKFYYISNVI